MTRRWPAITGTVLLPLLFYARATFSSDVFLGRDLLRSYLPLRVFWAEQVLSGHFPGWYPYDGLGQPFVGMTISSAFSPFNLLFLGFSGPVAIKLVVLLAAIFSFSGCVFWARTRELGWAAAYLAGAVFTFSAYPVGLSNNPQYLTAACAIPWAMALGDRFVREGHRSSLLFGALATAAIAWGGDPMNFCIALGAIAFTSRVWVSEERGERLLRAGGWGLASVGLAAVQIVPSLAIRGASVAADQSLAHAMVWSAHPLRLLEWFQGPVLLDPAGDRLAPGLAHLMEPALDSAWVESQSVGALPLGLAILGGALLLGRAGWPWLTGWLGVFVLWLGRFTPLGDLAYRFLPLWKSFRYPEKLTPWLLLGIALAAAMLAEAIIHDERVRAAASRGLFTVAAIPLVLLVPLWNVHREQLVLAVLSALGALAAAVVLRRVAPRWLGWVLVVFVMGQDFSFAQRLYWTGPAESLTEEPEFSKLIHAAHDERPEPARVWSKVGSAAGPLRLYGLSYGEFMIIGTREGFRPAVPALWKLDGIDAYFPARSAKERAAGLDAHAASWGVEYVISLASTRPVDAEPVSEDSALGLFLDRLPAASPRAYVTGGGTAQLTEYTPDRVVVDAQAPAESQLVLNDAWYPGWTATVDGAETTILVADSAVRAVLLPPGSHHVVFTWHTPGLLLGLALSALTLLALALVQLLPRT